MIQMIFSEMHSTSCANAYHDVTTVEVDGWSEKQKTEYLKNKTSIFYEIKIFLNYTSKTTFSEVVIF